MMPHRKLPHVGLKLDDMDERSMPEQRGLTWDVPRVPDDDRAPIRVQAEVGRPVGEIES